ncbi:DnaT-like ssDNA-binding protein [Stenotrophomonas sp.]|uniref:DnaT-like ssDNA-binding protein n=1 Tax=Stenotrophomonas sp. TaxID=69392 RepID=UPI0028AEE7F2|nr:DnaT-like ssDNA-binding protein [Stenotrophomonas sp.]
MLIVEDGTGLPNAEAYISAAEADTYHANRGNAAWAALDTPAKEAALRKATDYMGIAYGGRWHGVRLTPGQALDWPRGVVGVPEAVKRASAELALRASTAELAADQGPAVKSETVGPISVTYADGASQFQRYPLVDGLLASLLDGSYGQARVIRQ